ncbi:MAG: hypothetical protein GY765_39080 [bacterium]|nr:hypothetical protein [bacterium]
MPNKADLLLKLEVLEAIPEHKVGSPTVPIHVCIQEAEKLALRAVTDREQLEGAGLNWVVVEDIPIRAGALREAHTIWATAMAEDHADAAQWPEESVEGMELRKELVHKLRFAFRNSPKLLSRLRTVNKGKKQSQLMEALNHLCEMGRKHLDLLEAVKIDPLILDEAARYSDELAVALGKLQIRREDLEKKRVLRDKAYFHLKQAVDEVRGFGRYLFWKQPSHLKSYQSAYFRSLRGGPGDDDISAGAGTGTPEPEPVAAELEVAPSDIVAASV